MADPVQVLAELIALNGGELVGKTRLQKTCYLLEAAGQGCGLPFDYHHYGPYSAELAFAAEDAEALGLLRSEQHAGRYGVPYTVFKSLTAAPAAAGKDGARQTRQQLLLREMSQCSAIVLELAATLVFLWRNGYAENGWDELKRRKANKVTEERLAQVKTLLESLDLRA